MFTEKINRISISHFSAAVIICILIAFFYSGSLKNETALDDIMVVTENSYVQSGVKGIPDIFSHDSFYGATQKPATRLSWRYRPLSLVCFALIHEWAGNNWTIFHFFNLLLYFLCAWWGFRFLLQWIFPGKSLLALIASLTFVILPVHTEVVANIKSADELLACLFSILFLDQLLKWAHTQKKSALVFALFCFAAALFSKESSILLIVLTPVLLYVLSKKRIASSLIQSTPFFILTALFLLIRLGISQMPDNPSDITSDPYFLATTGQKLATVSLVLIQYLRLVFLPNFFSFDYGFQQISYVGFDDPLVIFSVLLHAVLLSIAIWWTFQRKTIGFFLLSYLAGIILMSNLFMNVGPIMADRFIFMPSFFIIVALLLFCEAITIRKKGWDIIIPAVLLLSFIPAAYAKTTERVADWKDNLTLYRADLKHAPNSFRVLAFNAMEEISLGQSLSDSAEADEKYRYGISLMQRAYHIYPDYKNMYFKWGIAYYNLGKLDSAEWAWGRLKALWPTSQYNTSNDQLMKDARYNEQMAIYNSNISGKDYGFLASTLKKALKFNPAAAPAWSLLGRVYYLQGKMDSSRMAIRKALELNPNNDEDKKMMTLFK